MIPKLTRRSAVAFTTAGLLAGCSGRGRAADASPATADPGAAVRRQAARDSQELALRYDAAAAAHPGLAARLAPLRAETARHAAAFGGRAPAPGSAAAGTAPKLPAAEGAVLAQLATAERTLADRRAAALLDAPGQLARLLASVAAAGAAHAALLGQGSGGKAAA
ncbi:hypothetical protein [Actinacidiphila yeochonensis]|uniref:hypothetical protein n=1 Tax=Actinacidiphila yeochonensis TaxID=89050 RepID=UPI00055B93D6|nr:hypothetical protein [Actinacidiphila yeochonensis]